MRYPIRRWMTLLAIMALAGCSTGGSISPDHRDSIPASIPTSITLSPRLDDGTMRVGKSVQMTLTTNIPPAYSVTWWVTDTAICVVSAGGLAQGLKLGSAKLVAEILWDEGRRRSSIVADITVTN